MIQYVLYAEDKDGFVTAIGRYSELSEITIRTSLFADGTRITIEEESDERGIGRVE